VLTAPAESRELQAEAVIREYVRRTVKPCIATVGMHHERTRGNRVFWAAIINFDSFRRTLENNPEFRRPRITLSSVAVGRPAA
jgi:hypothetical protein